MTEKTHIQTEMENMLNTRWGRSFLRRVFFEYTNILASPHNADPHAAAYNAGRHAVGLLILGEVLAVSPTHFAVLLNEEEEAQNATEPDDVDEE